MQKARKSRRITLKGVVGAVMVGAVSAVISGYLRDRNSWDEYNRMYGEYLALPNNLNPPHAKPNIPYSVAGSHSLTVKIYKPNSTDDATLRSWIVSHNRSSAFVPTMKGLAGPLGVWEATCGRDTISFDRLDEDGWITVSVFRRPTVAGKN